jgi:predicted nucleotide-binding protein
LNSRLFARPSPRNLYAHTKRRRTSRGNAAMMGIIGVRRTPFCFRAARVVEDEDAEDLPTGMCPLCRKSAEVYRDANDRRIHVNCVRCGRFIFGDIAAKIYAKSAPEKAFLLSGYTREQSETDPENEVVLGRESMAKILSQCPTRVDERLEKLVAAIRRQSTELGKLVPLNCQTDYPLGYAENSRALQSMVQALAERGIIEVRSSTNATDWVELKADFYEPKRPDPQIHSVLSSAMGEAVMQAITMEGSNPQSADIFVVHGHDTAARSAVELFLERQNLNPIILSEQPGRGATVIEKLERHGAVEFAVVILTGDDRGRAMSDPTEQPRARQNVILELGYFLGRLQRHRVVALYEEGVELPSDYKGVEYIRFSPSDAEWKTKLAKELEAAGYAIDWSKVHQ